MEQTDRRIPDPPGQGPGEPGEYYGRRLLVWLLASQESGSTFLAAAVTMSDEQLQRAHGATTEALSSRNMIGDEPTPACVYDRLETVRRELSGWIKLRSDRAAAVAEQLAQLASQEPGATRDSDSDGGRHARLQPVPPRFPSPADHAVPEYAPRASRPDIRF